MISPSCCGVVLLGYQRDSHAQAVSTPGSPTSRLLLEYEMHLRNTLAKGMDAESYSLHTFEALLTQSMENLGNFDCFHKGQNLGLRTGAI